jgi:hypothetical protein
MDYMIMNRYLLVAVLSILSSTATADCGAKSCTSKIAELYFRNVDRVFIKVSDDISALNCEPYGGEYITLEASHINFQPIYSALLASKSMKGEVVLRVAQGSKDCVIDYVIAR